MKSILHRFVFLYLDVISVPGVFMSKEKNALWHLKKVCPKCKEWRRKFRYVDSKECWWEREWARGNYGIPRSFGVKAWAYQYVGKKADLAKFRK
ncbi:hypothetical protein ACFL0V_00665 [Nanoarchaeota archaeon]